MYVLEDQILQECTSGVFIKDLVLNLEWLGVKSPKLLVKQHIFYIMFIWHISKHISFP